MPSTVYIFQQEKDPMTLKRETVGLLRIDKGISFQ